MTVVVDVGCMTYPEQDSVSALIDRFRPSTLYGFDPNPSLIEGTFYIKGVRAVMRQCAMWVYDGHVTFTERGTRSTVLRDDALTQVCCLDIVEWLTWATEAEEPIILKLDVEGAEYGLLEHIALQRADVLLDLILVEWHDHLEGYPTREALEQHLRCPVEDWHE